eukprot:CAMPEP_0177587080 /NCGR_PEP_ID=MMETSP0419_2-20121207/5437_1 /TAXON_ID=582737 /ORGANISM="Tetraselmis sp., Strain GSL018" /LENGTH=31 /DNA_ID= /DNA_START= /DNA_END= /DNA_ORIENTATION=
MCRIPMEAPRQMAVMLSEKPKLAQPRKSRGR